MALKLFFKDTIIYGITNALYSGLPLLLLPFLINTLGPEDYGKIELFRSISLVLVPLVGLSTVQSLTRFYYDLEEQNFIIFSSTIFTFQILSFLISIIFTFIFINFISKNDLIFLFLGLIYFLFNQIIEILLTIYRVNNNAKKYCIIRILIVVVELLFIYISFNILNEYNWYSRVIPSVLSLFFISIYAIYILCNKYKIKFIIDFNFLKISLLYSFPLVFHMLSSYIYNIGDKLFINLFHGESVLGSYAIVTQVSLIVTFFSTSINLAWTPSFFNKMKTNSFSEIKKVNFILYLFYPIVSFLVYIFWLYFSKYLDGLNKYNINSNYILILLIANVFISYYKMNSLYFFYYKKTKLLAIISIICVFVCLALFFLLIKSLIILGACISILITFFMLFILTYLYKPNKL